MIRTNFALMQHHDYDLDVLENMMPWEREVYIALLTKHLQDEKERMSKQYANR